MWKSGKTDERSVVWCVCVYLFASWRVCVCFVYREKGREVLGHGKSRTTIFIQDVLAKYKVKK